MTIEKISDTELLEKKICDYGTSKYKDLVVAMTWARVIKRQEENRTLPMAQLIEKALLDIVDNRITPEHVEEATVKQAADAAARDSAPRRREPRISVD
ncbi:MAG: hypothetical protein FD189_814 [Elusimicrobia bacterium]|nr:MAG: hypothetical protein FD154_807 [Elusimicrobiota bacterium]KAF0156841.1 MAG: hypothetical protein FD189_814 [Elusimicrobiota bacterium]